MHRPDSCLTSILSILSKLLGSSWPNRAWLFGVRKRSLLRLDKSPSFFFNFGLVSFNNMDWVYQNFFHQLLPDQPENIYRWYDTGKVFLMQDERETHWLEKNWVKAQSFIEIDWIASSNSLRERSTSANPDLSCWVVVNLSVSAPLVLELCPPFTHLVVLYGIW